MLQRFKASFVGRQYFTTSPVTLGIGRIALGLLVLGDVLRRWTDLDVWYTNAGLMPNHTMLWAPQARMVRAFSGVRPDARWLDWLSARMWRNW